jgi:hypothetical protein
MEKQAILPLIPLALGAVGAGMSLWDAYKAKRRGENGRALGNLGLAALSVVPGLGLASKGIGMLGRAVPWAGKAIGYAGRLGQAGRAAMGAGRAAIGANRYANAARTAINGAATAMRGIGGRALQYGVNNRLITNGMANFARSAPGYIGRAAKGVAGMAPAMVGWTMADNFVNGAGRAREMAGANYQMPNMPNNKTWAPDQQSMYGGPTLNMPPVSQSSQVLEPQRPRSPFYGLPPHIGV